MGSWPRFESSPARVDSDLDAMAYDWEFAHELAPLIPQGAAADCDFDGHAHAEEYLNSLVPPPATGGRQISGPHDRYIRHAPRGLRGVNCPQPRKTSWVN
jgi:hypothetical protein